MKYEIEVWRNL